VAGRTSAQDGDDPAFSPAQLDQLLLGGQQDRSPCGKQYGGSVVADLGCDDPSWFPTHLVDIPFHTSPFHCNQDSVRPEDRFLTDRNGVPRQTACRIMFQLQGRWLRGAVCGVHALIREQ
jgi:hypothetical protein